VKKAIKALVTSYSFLSKPSASTVSTSNNSVIQFSPPTHTAEILLTASGEEVQSFPLHSLKEAEVYLVDKKHYEDLLKRGQRLKNPIMTEYEEFN
jgi:hypothetical protein